jgi:hypothetical protein
MRLSLSEVDEKENVEDHEDYQLEILRLKNSLKIINN